jgi:hypothetical protein
LDGPPLDGGETIDEQTDHLELDRSRLV